MPTFEPFDVVAVPFPYVEREVRKRRPTVVVSVPSSPTGTASCGS